jgi:O-antigen ligase/tetratricopeptide (TPR) repeat protein
MLLGGGTHPVGQVVFLVLLGGILTGFPLRKLPDAPFPLLMGLLLFWGVISFCLPLSGFGASGWMSDRLLGWPLPNFLSAQPWLSADRFLHFLVPIVWFLLFISYPMSRSQRFEALRWVALVIVSFAVLTLCGMFWGFQHPFTQGTHRFSLFPNHNQSGAVFAMGGILCLGMALRRIRRMDYRFVYCLSGFVVICVVIFQGMSRSALLFLGAGSAMTLLPVFFSRSRVFYLKAGIPFALLLIAGFIAFSGSLVDEFVEVVSKGGLKEELRIQIFSDASDLIATFPLTGVGLGNFRYFFPMFQEESMTQQSIHHPESDWLWLASELGLPGTVLVMAILLVLLVRMDLASAWSESSSRLSCAVVAILFPLFSLIEVSGHRWGTVMLAMALGAVIYPDGWTFRERRWLPVVSRIFGFACVSIGLVWGGFLMTGRPFSMNERLDSIDQIQPEKLSVVRMERWLESFPLAAKVHHLYGLALRQEGRQGAALEAFRRAQILAPRRTDYRMTHGLWVSASFPDQALIFWDEALSVSGEDAAELFKALLRRVDSNGRVLLSKLSFGRPVLRFAYLSSIRHDAELFAREFERDLAADPGLQGWAVANRQAVLWRYARINGPAFATRLLARRPSIAVDLWSVKALEAASVGNWKLACEFAMERIPRSDVMDMTGGRSIGVVRAEYVMDGRDPLKVIALVQKYMMEGKFAEALLTVELAERKGVKHVYFDREMPWVLYHNGDYAAAWTRFEQLIENGLIWK